MIPAQFDYLAPTTLDEAVAALAQHGDDAKILAGGQSLIPVLRLRLAAPSVLIDLGEQYLFIVSVFSFANPFCQSIHCYPFLHHDSTPSIPSSLVNCCHSQFI